MEKPANIGILEEFRLEFLECWQRLPNKGFFLVLFVAWLALFQFLGNSTLGFIKTQSLLKWMYIVSKPNDTGEDDSHANFVPIIVLGLFWWKRKELMALEIKTWMPGLFVLGCGLIVHIAGYLAQQPRISIVGLFAGIYGLMGLAWGPAWLRKSFFPFCLLIFCVPLGTLSQPITFRLRMLVTQIVEVISHYILQIDIIRDGTAIKDPTNRYQYEVAAACSGIRSLISTIGLALIYGTISFRSWWKRGVIFASAIPLAIVGNTLRMLTIVIAAEIAGQKGGNYVHDGGPMGIFSLMPYIPVFIGLFMVGNCLREERRQQRPVDVRLRHGGALDLLGLLRQVRAVGAEIPGEGCQRRLDWRVGRARGSCSPDGRNVAVVVAGDPHDGSGVVRVRLVELRVVLARLPVEVHDVAEVVEERWYVPARHEVLRQLVGHGLLRLGVLDPAGVAHDVQHQLAGILDGRHGVGYQHVTKLHPVGVGAGRLREGLEVLVAPDAMGLLDLGVRRHGRRLRDAARVCNGADRGHLGLPSSGRPSTGRHESFGRTFHDAP